MCAYEFYWFDKIEKAHFIAILQENRENLLRITRESILTKREYNKKGGGQR
jgi:hypothetical protein